jgi:hypothetical protein
MDDLNINEIISKPINYDVPVKDHQNANIEFGNISEEELIKLGFRNNENDYYICKNLIGKREITFNLTIHKNDKRIKIDILDENFLQPYDYQSILKRQQFVNGININSYSYRVHIKVQEIMKWLLDNNIIIGYQLGDYI